MKIYLKARRIWFSITFIGSIFVAGCILGAYWHRAWCFPFPQISRMLQGLSGARHEDLSRKTSEMVMPVRYFRQSQKPSIYDTEEDGFYEYVDTTVRVDQVALVLMDVWANHPNDGWHKRAQSNVTSRIVPLLAWARQHGIVVCHAPHGREIHTEAKPIQGELQLDVMGMDGTHEFHKYLKEHGVKTLLYAGYASNWCVINRQIGIFSMSKLGYRTVIIRDCTIAFETPETFTGQWAQYCAINMVESQWGGSTTLGGLESLNTQDFKDKPEWGPEF